MTANIGRHQREAERNRNGESGLRLTGPPQELEVKFHYGPRRGFGGAVCGADNGFAQSGADYRAVLI